MWKIKPNFIRAVNYVFLRHPHSVGETYKQHLQFASFTGLKLVLAGIACCIHSILPFLFANTASETIQQVNQEILERKNKSP